LAGVLLLEDLASPLEDLPACDALDPVGCEDDIYLYRVGLSISRFDAESWLWRERVDTYHSRGEVELDGGLVLAGLVHLSSER
jgi:hypothetical protein